VLERIPSGVPPEEDSPESRRGLSRPRHEARTEISAASLELLTETQRIARLGGFIWVPGRSPQIWSDEFHHLLGYEPGSVVPGPEAFFAAVHPDDVERVQASWQRALEGEVEEIEYRVVHPTGEARFLRASGRVFRENGRVTHVVGALQDITDVRRTTVALEEALAIARGAERVAGVGSFVVRIEAMEMVWTEGLKLLTGLEEPNADAATHLERVHPDDRDKQRRWWDRLVGERVIEPLQVRMQRADGSVRHLYTQAAVVRLGDGAERVVGTTLDVTERVQLEDQLRHAAKMEAIGTLAAGLAHDFNNYLLVMDSSLSMLSDCDEPEEREELVEGGRLALSRCMELTRQLLVFARREPFRPESADLTEVVLRFHELLTRAVGRRATLRMEKAPGPLLTRVDPRHVERMLTNLVVNAADAIEQLGIRSGRIDVQLAAVTLAAVERATPNDVPPGAYVCVVVEDNGGGIAPERLPRIFDPYFTTKPEGRGTGLGLASVYGMARQNDGLVSVREVPAGTRFTLWFPRLEAMPEPSGVCAVAEPALPVADAADADVLVVEDVEPVRDIAVRILKSAGLRVLTARDGSDALAQLERGQKVRVILADLQLPVMGGREFAEQVSRRANPPPVIFMTGHVEEEPGSASSAPLLAKPFTPDRLVAFVRSAIAEGAA
jgi:two-component system cell cycle sensor histidine kinase/response regulator CckA